MPRSPILSRELFYDVMPSRPGVEGPVFRLLDFCLVNTTLGAMVEPRNLTFDRGRLTNIDAFDGGSFTKISQMDEDQMFALLGTAGQQLPIDYNV